MLLGGNAMTNNIHVNMDGVVSIVDATISDINEMQNEVNTAYSSLINSLSDASG